jgi:GNAT superfamily N-acetyltransferase
VRLSGRTLDWLSERCGAQVDEDDLLTAYAFLHPLNGTQQLTREEIPPDNTFFRWWVEFYTPTGERVLESPLARTVFESRPLDSRPGERDHVAMNLTFYVERRFQRQGFARAVYPVEEDVYRRWNIAEIQVHAQGDGCVVWVRHFGFQLKDPEVYEADYPAWARINGADPAVPQRAAEYPAAFLRSRTELHAYKVLR